MIFEVVEDARENPKKCTVHPLKEREDFRFYVYNGKNTIPTLASQWLLHHEGICMATLREQSFSEEVRGIAVIDCIWRRLEPIFQKIAPPLPKLVKIPEGFVTAYPRKSKAGNDPDGGLATIEAIFIASAFAGNWDESLLAKYHFGRDFLAFNEAQWQTYKLG